MAALGEGGERRVLVLTLRGGRVEGEGSRSFVETSWQYGCGGAAWREEGARSYCQGSVSRIF